MDANKKQNAVRQDSENLLNEFRRERLAQPYSLFAPKPAHLEGVSKHEEFRLVEGIAGSPEVEILYLHGMPRDREYCIGILHGSVYGKTFADFWIELSGVISQDKLPEDYEQLHMHRVGRVEYSIATPKTIPLGAGVFFPVSDEPELVALLIWRWRVFMDNSSLCLESNWYTDQQIWLPALLGIQFKDPGKMVADVRRFAPAFKLGNLIATKRVGRPPQSGFFKSNEDFLTALHEVLQKFQTKPSEPVALQRLSKHRLWRGNILTLEEATKTQKTLRNWLGRCEINWEDVCSKYFPNS